MVHVGAAAPPDERGWTVASEATLWCSDATLTVCGLMGDCPDELREIAVPGPGLVRVQVRGRDISAETDPGPEQPPEEYELHVWPVSEDSGLRTLRPDDGRPGWERVPARAAAWAVLRMITRANPDAQRRNLLAAAAPDLPSAHDHHDPERDAELPAAGDGVPGDRRRHHADPLAAAVEALYCATIALGDDHPRFLAEVGATFPTRG